MKYITSLRDSENTKTVSLIVEIYSISTENKQISSIYLIFEGNVLLDKANVRYKMVFLCLYIESNMIKRTSDCKFSKYFIKR